ncbi:unnamed protein product, partial [Brenthis ino]
MLKHPFLVILWIVQLHCEKRNSRKMNYSLEESPLTRTDLTREKMTRWLEAQRKGEKLDIDVYGKPSEKQLKELENVRQLSKELQENLHELENARADANNHEMSSPAPILDFSEDHEFVSANQLDDYYSQEDQIDAKEAEKQNLTKDGRISLKASRVVEKVVL